MEFEPGRRDLRAPFGQVELVGLALGSAPVVLGFGRDADDTERRKTREVLLAHWKPSERVGYADPPARRATRHGALLSSMRTRQAVYRIARRPQPGGSPQRLG